MLGEKGQNKFKKRQVSGRTSGLDYLPESCSSSNSLPRRGTRLPEDPRKRLVSDSPPHQNLFRSSENGETSQPLRRQGSIRKVLPSVPDIDTQLIMSAKMIDRRPGILNKGNNNSYAPFFLEYSLLAEYNLVYKQKLPGVYVVPAAKTPLQWFGILFLRQGYYMEGVFRFTLHIPENYPDGDPPRLIFTPSIFHPLINSETGELDVQRSFPKWRRNVNHIWQVLLFARKVFYKMDISNPINVEAATLFDKNLDLFVKKVNESLAYCKEHIYDAPETDDPHALRFSPLESQQFEDIKHKMLTLQRDDENAISKNQNENGLTWVEPGTLQIFSQDKSVS